jgi:hypothetical protein
VSTVGTAGSSKETKSNQIKTSARSSWRSSTRPDYEVRVGGPGALSFNCSNKIPAIFSSMCHSEYTVPYLFRFGRGPYSTRSRAPNGQAVPQRPARRNFARSSLDEPAQESLLPLAHSGRSQIPQGRTHRHITTNASHNNSHMMCHVTSICHQGAPRLLGLAEAHQPPSAVNVVAVQLVVDAIVTVPSAEGRLPL